MEEAPKDPEATKQELIDKIAQKKKWAVVKTLLERGGAWLQLQHPQQRRRVGAPAEERFITRHSSTLTPDTTHAPEYTAAQRLD